MNGFEKLVIQINIEMPVVSSEICDVQRTRRIAPVFQIIAEPAGSMAEMTVTKNTSLRSFTLEIMIGLGLLFARRYAVDRLCFQCQPGLLLLTQELFFLCFLFGSGYRPVQQIPGIVQLKEGD